MYRLAIEQAINTHMSSYFAEQQKNLSHIWESITLATFELKEKVLEVGQLCILVSTSTLSIKILQLTIWTHKPKRISRLKF